jgi:hypothetical protein
MTAILPNEIWKHIHTMIDKDDLLAFEFTCRQFLHYTDRKIQLRKSPNKPVPYKNVYMIYVQMNYMIDI